MTGAITTNSTFDGRDVATDGTKLDGIEASADVTDTANVTAAGALMDSELTNITAVKALNQGVATGDSPTFAGVTSPLFISDDIDFVNSPTSQIAVQIDTINSRLGIKSGSPDVTLDMQGAVDSIALPAGTTAQRPTGAAGMFRYNSTLEQFEGYTDAWGAIGGGGGSNLVSDTMTGDGSDTTLTLSNDPLNENNTQVYIDGVYQNKDTYSVSGTTLTFSTAPPNGSAVEAMTIQPTAVNVPADASVTSAKLSGDLTTPGALTVTGAFTSLGIDDNATSTAITIDSSENVGIGNSNPSAFNSLGATDKLVIGDSTDSNLTLFGTTYGSLAFADSDTSSSTAQYAGLIQYYHSDNSMQFYTNATERMRILSTGGITFNGDTAAANALDDYEEGTWTPAPSSGSFSTNIGTYTKVGRLVTVRFFCLFDSAGSGSSLMLISGLPFNVINSNSGYAPGVLMVDNLTTAKNNITIQPAINTGNFVFIIENGSTSDHAGAPASLFSNGSSLRGTLVYESV